ncbi:MAG TPA: hypothetical protein VIN56_07050 [Candidatus Dormibacteraeota bacterium]|jgi:hypothetical protein
MRVTVRFVDGERVEGDAEQVSLDSGGFTLVGPGGNTRSIWVSAGAIKYVAIHPAPAKRHLKRDPRTGSHHPKLVLHFLDGEVIRTYRDEVYAEQNGGFTMRLWDDEHHQLVKALISGISLKGVFTVDTWDSRTEEAKRSHDLADAPETVVAPTPVEKPLAQAEPVALEDTPDPEVSDVPEGPLVVEQPMLVDEPTEPAPVEETAISQALVARGDAEERRVSFGSGLARRRSMVNISITPAEERHRQLRERVSEILQGMTPDSEDDSGG